MVRAATSFSRNGVSDWIVQRVSAIVMTAYFVFLAGYLVVNPDLSYEQWQALFSCTAMRVFSIAAVVSLVAHGWIGMWGISTDYLTTRMMGSKGTVLRLLFQAVCAVIAFTYLVWGISILWGA